jgi:hypothetical protein
LLHLLAGKTNSPVQIVVITQTLQDDAAKSADERCDEVPTFSGAGIRKTGMCFDATVLPKDPLLFPATEDASNFEINLERRRSVPVCEESGYIGRTRSAHENSPREWAVRSVCGICTKVVIFTIMFKRSERTIVVMMRLSFFGIFPFA